MAQRSVRMVSHLAFGLMLFLSACNVARATPGATSPDQSPADGLPAAVGMEIRFVNLTDGGTVTASLDESGRPVVQVQVQITGVAPMVVTMTANGMQVFGEATNPDGEVPFTADLTWIPLNGGGEYTLVVTAITADKQMAETSATVTVTGVPTFTATPPPLDRAAAQRRLTGLYQQLYGVDIPAPSMQRFDFPNYPQYSRWISSVYYRGQRYYIDLFDDTHYELNPLPFADAAGQTANTSYILCRPAGHYKVLVAFVDYGNLGVTRDQALAQVAPMAAWTDQLYTDFAVSQGFSSSPLSIEADGVFISPPPAAGSFLTSAQILAATGVNPASYDFVIEIDLNNADTIGETVFRGGLEPGGGVALQGCGARGDYGINIWSSVPDGRDVQGALVMDFNHELSHLFGMLDNWPFGASSLVSPDGSPHDDWIPYEMFGWTDTDGDGIPEIIDPTPYGTSGPLP